MGFVVENTKVDEESTHSAYRGNTALVYGKKSYMWLVRRNLALSISLSTFFLYYELILHCLLL